MIHLGKCSRYELMQQHSDIWRMLCYDSFVRIMIRSLSILDQLMLSTTEKTRTWNRGLYNMPPVNKNPEIKYADVFLIIQKNSKNPKQ